MDLEFCFFFGFGGIRKLSGSGVITGSEANFTVFFSLVIIISFSVNFT